MLTQIEYSKASDKPQELTYKRQRGYWYWRCQLCDRQGQERIPDKAQDHYQHNPGNPALVICGRCTEYRFDSARIRLNGKRKPKNGKPIKESQDSEADSEAISGIWGDYMAIARQFERKAIYEDREDLRHDIALTLAEVDRDNGNGHKPLTQAAKYRIASRTVADYWRAQYGHWNGTNCGRCSKTQRKECRDNDLYSECPKAIKLQYLSQPITDHEGNITELGSLIADDKAIDLAEWLDASTWLMGCPQRLIAIAHKRINGIVLTPKDQEYLRRFRQREQNRLF